MQLATTVGERPQQPNRCKQKELEVVRYDGHRPASLGRSGRIDDGHLFAGVDDGVCCGHPSSAALNATSDYRKVKDHNSRIGVNRKNWKWFDMMDTDRQVWEEVAESMTDTSLLESMMESAVEDPSSQEETTEGFDERLSTSESLSSPSRTSTPTPPESAPSPSSAPRRIPIGKRKRGQQDVVAALAEMQAADERQQEWLERMEECRDRRFEMMLEDASEARRHEAEITRQHMEQTESFSHAFLSRLSQLVQVLSSRP
ncbi:hypothetical protein G5714_008744 [Onychostoma macrolepis]|uniref:Uncharacterized protein n=1 Tax=Onychostoma macrolepis TaxID=369639 RepID=A0A7J6CYC7_9TELE|nr:hypothetical protein G5714_008744 [Onychostoma macrolepis]